MARAIDADAVKRRAWDIAEAWKGQGRNYEALLLESVVEQIVDTAPTLTPPDEPLMLAGRLTPKMVTCPKGWKGVRDTRFYCPGCKKAVKKGEAYCHKCGQALIFPAERYNKENNRIWLDFSDRRPPEKEEDT
nr:MAG TPA: Thaumarchaeal output domain 1 [Bacteriophage sp.]